ncbi:hypothetical protein JL721_11878 [Aureococcus anophagefferens]|nr:hypothetical protein JL721_11878 [Aureococcus anophagefferens]
MAATMAIARAKRAAKKRRLELQKLKEEKRMRDEEEVDMWLEKYDYLKRSKFSEVFDRFDYDKSGKLEWKNITGNTPSENVLDVDVTDGDVEFIIHNCDKNHGGAINR